MMKGNLRDYVFWSWWNYKALEWESHPDGWTPEGAAPLDYLPQEPAAAALYDLYRKQGLSWAEAFKRILEACLGLNPPDVGHPEVEVESGRALGDRARGSQEEESE